MKEWIDITITSSSVGMGKGLLLDKLKTIFEVYISDVNCSDKKFRALGEYALTISGSHEEISKAIHKFSKI